MNGAEVEIIINEIREKEAEAQRTARELAALYAKLVAEAGGFRAAARIAVEHGLAYAEHSSLRRLIYWNEFCNAVDLENEGGDGRPHPTEWQVRPLLIDHFWTNAGPGGLAELWAELEEQTPKALIEAAHEKWPRSDTVDKTNAEDKRIVKGIAKAHKTGGVHAVFRYLATAIGPDALAELADYINDHPPVEY